LGTTFGWPLTPKIRESKNKRAKLGAISATFDFDREYLQNELRYRKSEKQVIDYSWAAPPALSEKIVELWSTNKKCYRSAC